jgi:hypothetical protein
LPNGWFRAFLGLRCLLAEGARTRRAQIIIGRMKRWWNAIGGLVGLAVVFAGIGLALFSLQNSVVHKIGCVLLGLALLAFVLGLEPVQRLSPWKLVPRDKMDDAFWEKAFEELPFPAFVKLFPYDRHIGDSKALKHFQGPKSEEGRRRSEKDPAEKDLAKRIDYDHEQGDAIATKEGFSVQLEMTDKVSTLRPRLILTLKSRLVYDNKKYIVGCYVPVILPADLPSATRFSVSECGGQILFRCPSPAADGDRLVRIGKSVQTAQAAPKKSQPDE